MDVRLEAVSRSKSIDLGALAENADLARVTRRQSLPQYVAAVWRRRSFVIAYGLGDLQAQGSQSLLGNVWLVLTPLLTGAIYYGLFGLLLQTGHGVSNFVGYLVVGIFLFQLTSRAVTEGARSVSSRRRLVQTLALPAATLPCAVVVRHTVTSLLSIATMLVILLLTPVQLSWRWVLIVPVLALQLLFTFGLTLVLARVAHRVDDVMNLLPFVLRVWLYASGVFYSIDRFAHDGPLKAVFQANPMHLFFTLARDCLLYADVSPPWVWGAASLWALGMVLLGVVVFWQAEDSYGRDW